MNDNVVTEEMVNRDNSNVVLKPKFIPLYIEPLEMWLSLIEVSIYWFVEFFLSTNKYFYCTNEQIANMLHIWTTAVSKAINKLNDLWLIYTEYRIRSWWGKIRFIKLLKRVDEINQTTEISGDNNLFIKTIPEVVENTVAVAVDETDVVKEGEEKAKTKAKTKEKDKDKNEKRKFDNKTKRLYWNYVSLTDEEYARLVYAFWRTEFVKDEKNHILKLTIHSKVVDDMIDNVNDRIDEKWNKAKYKDYYKALLKRFRNRKISTYYEYDNRDWENELVEHFKTDPQGNLALRYKRDHCKKKKDILDFYRLADKCWYSLTQNFDFLSESDEEKRHVEMYTDWWLVKDREW